MEEETGATQFLVQKNGIPQERVVNLDKIDIIDKF